jgi:hypothetical protein
VHRAAQRVGVAVALEKAAAGGHTLVAVGIHPHREIGIARLQRRMNQVAGEHRLVLAAAEVLAEPTNATRCTTIYPKDYK